jgi:hypothetical protein
MAVKYGLFEEQMKDDWKQKRFSFWVCSRLCSVGQGKEKRNEVITRKVEVGKTNA